MQELDVMTLSEKSECIPIGPDEKADKWISHYVFGGSILGLPNHVLAYFALSLINMKTSLRGNIPQK